jgi:hypothetical protein
MIGGKFVSIVEGTARPIWMPVSCVGGTAQTVYVGGLVNYYLGGGDGVLAPIAANAAPMGRPFGVVLGTNNLTPLYNTTYNAEYQSSPTSTGSMATDMARDWRMQEGMWIKGDSMPLVQVALIDPTSVLRFPIYAHATTQTAPTEAISTSGLTTGLGVTCATTGFDFTGIAYQSTYFCRKGLNKGLYRIGYDTNAGTGAKTWYQGMNYTCATVGETWVGVDFQLGRTKIDLQTTGLGINIVTSTATNYYSVDVLEIHLEEANNEYALVRFI